MTETSEQPLALFVTVTTHKIDGWWWAYIDGVPGATVRNKKYKQEAIDEAMADAKKIIQHGIARGLFGGVFNTEKEV